MVINDIEIGDETMAYLSQVKSGGKQYIYLTEYCGNQDYSSKLEKHIFSFGNSSVALWKLKGWLKRFDTDFPDELKTLGYTRMDLEYWIKILETGITKNGRKFKVENQKTCGF